MAVEVRAICGVDKRARSGLWNLRSDASLGSDQKNGTYGWAGFYKSGSAKSSYNRPIGGLIKPL